MQDVSNQKFQAQLEACGQFCCQKTCGGVSWLNFSSQISPFGKLSCRYCEHVACSDCDLRLPSILPVLTHRMQVHADPALRATCGWICSAAGCGWSQIVEYPPEKAPGFLQGLFKGRVRHEWLSGLLLDFTQQKCRFCNTPFDESCIAFQMVDPDERIVSQMQGLVAASKNAWLGSITPQAVTSPLPVASRTTAVSTYERSAVASEIARVLPQAPLMVMSVKKAHQQSGGSSQGVVLAVVGTPSKSKTPTLGSNKTQSNSGPTFSTPATPITPTFKQPTGKSRHVHWADERKLTAKEHVGAADAGQRRARKQYLSSPPPPPSPTMRKPATTIAAYRPSSLEMLGFPPSPPAQQEHPPHRTPSTHATRPAKSALAQATKWALLRTDQASPMWEALADNSVLSPRLELHGWDAKPADTKYHVASVVRRTGRRPPLIVYR